MGMYRKKPVVVEALPFTPTMLGDLIEFLERHEADFRIDGEGSMAIKTLEGIMHAHEGDWIICGVKGEVYPCKGDIFEATYEAA